MLIAFLSSSLPLPKFSVAKALLLFFQETFFQSSFLSEISLEQHHNLYVFHFITHYCVSDHNNFSVVRLRYFYFHCPFLEVSDVCWSVNWLFLLYGYQRARNRLAEYSVSKACCKNFNIDQCKNKPILKM